MKEGPMSRVVWIRSSQGPRTVVEIRAALMSLSPPRGRTRLDGSGSGCAIPKGRSGRQTKSGASRSSSVEGFVAGQHVPDRVRQAPCHLDLGDLGAALLAEPLL